MRMTRIRFDLSNTKPKNNVKGFTIIELLIATTIFSMALVVIVASFLQVGRMFYKGVSVNSTNEAARTLVDDITNDTKLSSTYNLGNSADPDPNIKKYFCIGSHRYTYWLNKQVKAGDINANSSTMNAGVIQDVDSGCHAPGTPAPSNRQILGPDMQLNDLRVVKNASGSGIAIHAHVIFYGVDKRVFNSSTHPNDTDVDHDAALKDRDAYCSGNLLSTQFCAMSDIDTNVTLKY